MGAAQLTIPTPPSGRRPKYSTRLIAREISRSAKYFEQCIQWSPLAHDSGELLAAVECDQRYVARAPREIRADPIAVSTMALLNGNFNFEHDIQATLDAMRPLLGPSGRLCAVLYNPYFGFAYRLAARFSRRRCQPPCTFVTEADLQSIAELAGWKITRTRPVVHFPWKWLWLGVLINMILAALPLVRRLSLAWVVHLRPIPQTPRRCSLSIIVPARNERGNIRDIVARLPDFGAPTEVIFVEGHSVDNTWGEILAVAESPSAPIAIRAYQQTGKGKADAVQLGFEKARNELLVILDADMTVPPEMMLRFYEAYVTGVADFVNGSRLLYPMESGAMRPLNRMGNIFFAKALSCALDLRITDALCGTKMLSAADYARIVRWKADFGNFDPFGDFDLLFGCAVLGIGLVNLPIRYQARTYGATNIQRFRDGLRLLRMTLVGLLRIKLGMG